MSIINDVHQAIKHVDRIGVSKKQSRRNGDENYIHSYSQKTKVETIAKEFANFCRDNYDVKKLHEVSEEHYRHFLATKSDTTLGHQRNIETALQQLQKGLEVKAEKYNKEFKPFLSERLVKHAERGENVADRSYTKDEIEGIKEHVTDNSRIAVELMEKIGLRVSEACAVKTSDVDFERSLLTVKGKGGRERQIPLKNDLKGKLERLSERMGENERFVKTAAKTVSENCKSVANKLQLKNWTGTHGFRHSFARAEIDELMTADEKRMFDKCLRNYADGKRFDYAVRERELYHSMKNKMDQVHKKLGHGKNRFDLAIRYMR